MRYLFLIRHGETDWNLQNRIQSQLDIPLNQRGWQQAEKLANALKGEPLDVIYSSSLSRAYRTAQLIARPHRLLVVTDTRLNEIDQGKWTSLTVREARKRYPVRYQKWQTNPLSASPPQGESILKCARRVSEFLKSILSCSNDRSIAIVAHKVVGALIRILVENRDQPPRVLRARYRNLWSFLPGNAQLMKFWID